MGWQPGQQGKEVRLAHEPRRQSHHACRPGEPPLQLAKSGLITTQGGGWPSLETGWINDFENRRKYGESLNGTRWTLGDKGRFLEGSCEFLGTGVMANENQLGNVCTDFLRLKRLVAGNQSGEKKTLHRAGTREGGRYAGTVEVALKGRKQKGHKGAAL